MMAMAALNVASPPIAGRARICRTESNPKSSDRISAGCRSARLTERNKRRQHLRDTGGGRRDELRRNPLGIGRLWLTDKDIAHGFELGREISGQGLPRRLVNWSRNLCCTVRGARADASREVGAEPGHLAAPLLLRAL